MNFKLAARISDWGQWPPGTGPWKLPDYFPGDNTDWKAVEDYQQSVVDWDNKAKNRASLSRRADSAINDARTFAIAAL